MKQIKTLLGILIVSAIMLTSCGTKTAKGVISEKFDIDTSECLEISDYDSHSGNGDGISIYAVQFSDDSMLKKIQNNPSWHSLPFDEITEILAYGKEMPEYKIGPYIADNDGNSLVPKVQNGYYFLNDRHEDRDKPILDRYSFNLDLNIYDTDTKTLYFCSFDT